MKKNGQTKAKNISRNKSNKEKNKRSGQTQSGKHNVRKVALGIAAVAGVVGTVAGAYYLYGSSKAKEHREKVSAWFKNAREEVMVEAKKLKQAAFNKKNYTEIVKSVAKRYQDLRKLDSTDVIDFIKKVGSEWTNLGEKVKTRDQDKK